MGSSLCKNWELRNRSMSTNLGSLLLVLFGLGAYLYMVSRERAVGWQDARASSSSIDIFTGVVADDDANVDGGRSCPSFSPDATPCECELLAVLLKCRLSLCRWVVDGERVL